MSTNQNLEKIYLGDTYTNYLIVSEQSGPNEGDPIDADELPVVNIFDPNGDVYNDVGDVVGPNPVGTYSVDLTVVDTMLEGPWHIEWSFVLGAITYTKHFYVYVTPSYKDQAGLEGTQYATAQQIRNFSASMGISDIPDNTLDMYSLMASRLVDDYCHRTFGISTEEEKYEGMMDVHGRYFFKMKKKPVIQVNFVKLQYIGFPASLITIDETKLDLFAKAGYAYYANAYFMRTQGIVLRDEYKNDFYYTINYDAGEAVPPAVSMATVMVVQNFLSSVILASGTGVNQSIEQSDSVSSFKSMSYSVGFNKSDMANKDTGRLFTVSVRELLDRYRVIGQSW